MSWVIDPKITGWEENITLEIKGKGDAGRIRRTRVALDLRSVAKSSNGQWKVSVGDPEVDAWVNLVYGLKYGKLQTFNFKGYDARKIDGQIITLEYWACIEI